MKKQILAYRQEIIELSTHKKQNLKDKSKNSRKNVPRLDLSKVKQDSDDSSDEEKDNEDDMNKSKQ